MDVAAPIPTDGNGKRSRKPKTFTGYLTETNDAYFEEEESTNDQVAYNVDAQKERPSPPGAAATSEQPQAKRRKSTTVSAAAMSTTKRQQQQASPSAAAPATAAMLVKKVAGVQNATRKALEWLQYGDLSVIELTQSLPKLSKARVEIVMEALRAAGLVTLVRKHAPDASGQDHVNEVYRFSAGRSAAEALEIGGGKPVVLGSISKRIKASQAELLGLNERINVLKAEAAKSDPEPQQVLEILRQFMKQDKSLEEDPFYSVAYKATCTAATKAAKAAAASARAAAIALARKKAAEDAVAAAAVAAAADSRRKAQEAAKMKKEQEVAALQEARRRKEEGEGAQTGAATAGRIATAGVAASAASTAAAAAAFSAAASTAALLANSVVPTPGSVVCTVPSSSLPPAGGIRTSQAVSASSSAPAVATVVAEPPAPFVGELGGLVVSGTIAPRPIPPTTPGRQQ
ncbi:unnamed protein product [Pylaiella littoralis]